MCGEEDVVTELTISQGQVRNLLSFVPFK